MKIDLNNKISIDIPKLIVSRMLIQANSGGGKSHTIRRIIEQAGKKVQIIVIDPEGEFSNLRSKHDFAYIGRDGDAPAETRSAALLARRLLELKASAIIDLYELSPQERKRYVRLFCESMVDAPKDLWHEVLVIIDEAHVFAPEKAESEALGAVIDLGSRGRKRGFCLIAATQRPAKLNKDVAAECNNKLIGRATLDIDRKRGGEELGFTTKEQFLSLRDLEPGEFYVFGPAVSREVQKIQIGDVSIKPERLGVARKRPPAPSDAIKKIIGQLKDLPQEAVKEAKDMQQLQTELRAARAQIATLEKNLKSHPHVDSVEVKRIVEKNIRDATALRDKAMAAFKKEIHARLLRVHGGYQKILDDLQMKDTVSFKDFKWPDPVDMKRMYIEEAGEVTDKQWEMLGARGSRVRSDGTGMVEGEKRILTAIIQHGEASRELLTLVTGYKRSTRDAYIQRLNQRGYVNVSGVITATEEGRDVMGEVPVLPTGSDLAKHYMRTLPEGERKVFQTLYESGPLTRDEVSDRTGYKRSTRDAYIQRLATRQLVKANGGSVEVNEHFL